MIKTRMPAKFMVLNEAGYVCSMRGTRDLAEADMNRYLSWHPEEKYTIEEIPMHTRYECPFLIEEKDGTHTCRIVRQGVIYHETCGRYFKWCMLYRQIRRGIKALF